MIDGPYTTITVDDYNYLTATLKELRTQLQKVRVLLENGHPEKALEILREDPSNG